MLFGRPGLSFRRWLDAWLKRMMAAATSAPQLTPLLGAHCCMIRAVMMAGVHVRLLVVSLCAAHQQRSLGSLPAGALDAAFIAASGVMRWDIPLMTFLLPHVVRSVVSHGSGQAIDAVHLEITAVTQVRWGMFWLSARI